jgi:DegV family protein with EDD domain
LPTVRRLFNKEGTMSRVVIVTDSTADFPDGVVDRRKIAVVPLYVRFGGEEYRDRVNLSGDEFFDRLKKSQTLPMTSQPTPDDFLRAYKKAGPKIFSLHISSKLSGTLESARGAAKELPMHFEVGMLDSQTLSLGLGFLVMKAAEMAETGARPEEIREEIERLIPKIRLYGALDTLNYLEKGGRIGAVSAFLGSLLQIKPIISVRNGEVVPVERNRSKAKSLERLVEIVAGEGQFSEIGVIHAAAQDEAKDLARRLKAVFPGRNIPIVQTGTIIGTHSGPGLVGICGLLK